VNSAGNPSGFAQFRLQEFHMPTRTKSVITGLSAAALVASISYAFAQSSDDTALANSNFNGAQNSADTTVNGPPAMPPEAAAAVPGGTETPSIAAPSSETMEPSTAPPAADTSTAATATDPNAVAVTPGTAQDMTNSATASPSGEPTHPAAAPPTNESMTASPGTAPSTSGAAAPSSTTSTYVELNSPSEPQYNIESERLQQRNDAIVQGRAPSSGAPSGELAPRADRN